MLHGTALATVVAFGLSLSLASPLSKRAALEDCLSSSGVSVDSQGSDDWSLDVAPFNLRLNFTPVAIAVPTTVKQIQDAVACAVKLGVKANPKCGGHSYGSFGLGGEDGHLTIELDRMSKVTLDNKTGIATIEGGSRLGHVAAELYAQGKRAFSHGTCPGVGVAGHTLHGGFGLSSHTKGLALDALVSAKVVLANSTVVSCSATENPDVFWALRGAGGSMGVVAEFQFQTFAVPEQVTIFVASAPWKQDKAAAGLKAFQDYVANTMPAELNMRLFLNRIYANFEGLYYGDKAGLVAALQPFLNATNGTLQYTQTGTWLDQVKHFGNGVALNQTHPYDMHETFYSSSLYSQALTDQQLAAFVDYWFGAGKKQTRNWWIQVDAHGGKNSAIPKVPGDSTSYAHRDYLFLYQFYDRVNFGAYPADGFPFLQSFIGNLTGTMKDGEWGRYVNYPDTQLDQATAQKNYWGGHLAKLQAIKAQLDPKDVFHYPQGILPAASA